MSLLSICFALDSQKKKSNSEFKETKPQTSTFHGDEFINAFTHAGDAKTGTFITPPNASVLHVQLWGAGGGGGGCQTTSEPNVYAVGAGGGGGGFAEAYLRSPLEESYDYYIAQGGMGGDGETGESAETSWFGKIEDVTLVSASGGQGGGSIIGSNATSLLAMGGLGGSGDGSKANLKAEASAGGNSLHYPVYGYVIAGEGGAAPYLSGYTQQQSSRYSLGVSSRASGLTGCTYGGAGSGSFIVQESTISVKGGDGTAGFISIIIYSL